MALADRGADENGRKDRENISLHGPGEQVERHQGDRHEKARKRQALELQRERILSERTSSAHRRTALTNALADIEEKLAELGWTIHLG